MVIFKKTRKRHETLPPNSLMDKYEMKKKEVGFYKLDTGSDSLWTSEFIISTYIKPSWLRRKCMKILLGFCWIE